MQKETSIFSPLQEYLEKVLQSLHSKKSSKNFGYIADCNWKKYPIVRMDFSAIKTLGKEDLIKGILSYLNQTAREYNIELEEENYDQKFSEFIPQKKYYQTIFYLIFTLVGLHTSAEVKKKHRSSRCDNSR